MFNTEEIFENVDTISCDEDEYGLTRCRLGTLMDAKEPKWGSTDELELIIGGWLVSGRNFEFHSISNPKRCVASMYERPYETDLGTDIDVVTKIRCD
mgnify:CR=1 FL=1